MSGSEPRSMPGRGGEPYGMAHQNPSPGSSPSGGSAAMSSMCLAFSQDTAAVYKPIMPNSPSYHQSTMAPSSASDGGSLPALPPPFQSVEAQPSIDMNTAEPARRKRGRPRKYPLDDSMTPPPPSQPQHSMSSGSGFSGAPSASPSGRRRGRPPGSGRKQQETSASGSSSSRVGITPHVITVQAGEDITARVLSFTQNGARAVCVLSANGAIANVTLRQSSTSGRSVTYEGRFDILSLSGSFTVSESAGHRSITGGLSVSLAGPDGRVLGGCVTGHLVAASPIQVVVGSFAVESETDVQSDVPLFVPPLRGVGPRSPPMNHPGIAGSSNSKMGTSMQWK